MPGPRDQIFHNARILRNNQTPAERHLWAALRKRGIGKKFRRQHRIGNYIVDFYCPALKLAVEIDGGQHDSPESRQYDEKRTRFLQEQGIRVLRFWNNEVLQQTENVLEALWCEVNREAQP